MAGEGMETFLLILRNQKGCIDQTCNWRSMSFYDVGNVSFFDRGLVCFYHCEDVKLSAGWERVIHFHKLKFCNSSSSLAFAAFCWLFDSVKLVTPTLNNSEKNLRCFC